LLTAAEERLREVVTGELLARQRALLKVRLPAGPRRRP
jgi:hypothetical protein